MGQKWHFLARKRAFLGPKMTKNGLKMAQNRRFLREKWPKNDEKWPKNRVFSPKNGLKTRFLRPKSAIFSRFCTGNPQSNGSSFAGVSRTSYGQLEATFSKKREKCESIIVGKDDFCDFRRFRGSGGPDPTSGAGAGTKVGSSEVCCVC